jgi:hypothetical protein
VPYVYSIYDQDHSLFHSDQLAVNTSSTSFLPENQTSTINIHAPHVLSKWASKMDFNTSVFGRFWMFYPRFFPKGSSSEVHDLGTCDHPISMTTIDFTYSGFENFATSTLVYLQRNLPPKLFDIRHISSPQPTTQIYFMVSRRSLSVWHKFSEVVLSQTRLFATTY